MKRAIVRILRIVLPLAVLGGAGFAAVTMIRNQPPVETQRPIFVPPGVRVEEVTLRDVPLSVTSQGTVRPRTESQLVPEIAGRITWVAPSFAEGGFFEAGDVLVKIDPFDYQQAVVSARAQLAQARLRLAQEEAESDVALREWAELGRGDPRELTLRKPHLEDARASVAAAEANLERAARDLERAEIVAPYAGRIREKNVDIGQFVRIGDAVATVYAVDIAEVRLPLPDEQLAYLDLPLSYRGGADRNQPRVTLRTTFAGETHEWQGRIVRTESEIDPVSRMVHVVAQVEDPYAPTPNPNRPPLAVGMYVEAEIEGRVVRNVAVVPRAALRGLDQVLVVDPDDRLFFRDVDVLRATTDTVFVRAGLTSGELVAVSPLDAPSDGMRVQLADAEPGLLARRRGAVPTAATAAVSAPSPDAAAAAATVATNASAPTAEATSPQPAQPSWLDSLVAPDAPTARTAARAETAAPAGPAREPDRMRARRESPTPPPPPPAATASPADPDAVAVLPFENLNRDAGDPALGAALTRAVSARLSADAVAMTDSEGDARYVIAGGIQQIGTMVRVTARIVDNAEGAVLRALKVDGTTDDQEALRTAVVLAVGGSIETILAGGDAAPVVADANALAVLPFNDLGPGGEAATSVDLGAAIADAVAARLAELPVVTLVASVDGATWIVGGGVQTIGGVVRVTARLIDAESGAVLKAVKVDGTIDALAELQERVAAALSDSVRDALSAQDAADGLGAGADVPGAVGRRP